MAYCYECGSEVAPIDIFCPYCGISLKAALAAENESGDGVDASEIQLSPIDENVSQSEDAKTEDYGLTGTKENLSSKTESIEFQFNKSENMKSQETVFNRDMHGGAPALSESEKNENSESNAEPAHDFAAESAQNRQPVKVEQENDLLEITDTDEFSSTIPYISPLLAKQSAQASEKNEVERDTPREPASPEANVSPIEAGIAKPSEELEMPEPPSKSVFDSVRIIESHSVSDKPVSEELRSASRNNVVHLPPARSKTMPNFGIGDTDGKKSAKLKPLEEGIILNGRYEIIRKIGGGGMGAVYLASDNNLGGVLRAVKEMVQSYIEDEQQEKAINDFKRESMILSTLDHPSIPTIYDYFYDEKESRFYLVMKYISGGDLSARLRSAPEGKIDERSVTEWAIQIADVLDYLHNRPTTIVYRDLKPSNVMIDGNTGRVMLIDFGIARSVNKEEKGVTAVGTMGYAPPELFSGNVEPRSDIYSLGSTMFHLLTGADPQSNPLLIFDFQKNPRPRQINSALSDQIEKILMRSVEYNVQSRFSSAGEMRRVLEEHFENLKAGRVTYGIKETPASVGLENQSVFCGFCGQRIMATDMFCAFCGSRQPLSQKGVHSEIYSNAAVTAKLMILGTNELESPVFNLDKEENLLGRRDPMSNIFPEVDLSKFDPQTKISRRHARIWRDGSIYMVEDLGSSNGTVVIPAVSETIRLQPHHPHVLANGDKIRLGDTTLHFALR
jgi:serine/threonine-protein kinase